MIIFILFSVLLLTTILLLFFLFKRNEKNKLILKNDDILKQIKEMKKKNLKKLSLLKKGQLFFILLFFQIIFFLRKIFKKKNIYFFISLFLIAAAAPDNNEKVENGKDKINSIKESNVKNPDLEKCSKILEETLLENQNLLDKIEKILKKNNSFLENTISKNNFLIQFGIPIVNEKKDFNPFFILNYFLRPLPFSLGMGISFDKAFVSAGFYW